VRTSRRSIALLCIAVTLLAGLLPGAAALLCALAEPSWVFMPASDSSQAVPAPAEPSLTRTPVLQPNGLRAPPV